ncbi:hypothetical protein SE17_13870 [Kouleothrix aurantiaca]|uniref:Secreted protein n=1 Tax=Kouleothrix aurantiaca TaxID=186479 RepID=A0A0P9D1B7_9CHLR|nr:hypothetical protein SE17_13870 [Kouleothrix aurantiaca]
MQMLRYFLAAVAVLMLAACGGTPSANGPQPAGTTVPAPTAPGATAAPAPAPTAGAGAPLVVYHKSGGIMGLDDTLTVNADGTFTLKDRAGAQSSGQATAEQLGKLNDLLNSMEFAAASPNYPAAGADMFVYKVEAPAQNKTVTAMDGTDYPQVLHDIIDVLESMRAQVQ